MAIGRPKANHKANGVLTVEVPAAAEAAHVPAAKAAAEAGEMTATEAAHVAEVCAGEMTATELAAGEAAHVAEVSAGEMTATELAAGEAAHVAEASAGEMTATELAAGEAAHVAEVSAAEMSPAPMEGKATVEVVVEAVMEAADSDEDRTTKPVAIVVIRIGVAVTIVVAGAIIRPIVVVAVRIVCGDAADHLAATAAPGL